jgi:glycosyltransferase involved in cell wall biosynthesis
MASERAPAITSIVPVYNGATYIGAAIDSLARQSLSPTEIVVVDDGSTDDSGERAIAAGKGLVRLIRQPNRGLNAARNAGCAAATGEFIHFTDADDIVPENALELMHAALAANPGWDAVFGNRHNFWVEELAVEEQSAAAAHLRGVQAGHWLTAGMFRACFVQHVAPFASTSDSDDSKRWLLQSKTDGALFGVIDSVTLERRIHSGNRSRQKSLDGLTDLVLNLHRAARQAARHHAGKASDGEGAA